MAPGAGPVSPSDGISPAAVSLPSVFSGSGALSPSQKDKVIEWYRGEFAAANAIIDTLRHHLVQLAGGDDVHIPEEYETAFSVIQRRRLNWIPVLQKQDYFTIADVALELRKASARARRREREGEANMEVVDETTEKIEEEVAQGFKTKDEIIDANHVKCNGNDNGNANGNVTEDEESPDSEITDTSSHEVLAAFDHIDICDNHEECAGRREQIKMTKGFVAKESVRGHMVNVVKGLKMFEDIFTDSELSKLNDFVNELRAAGQNGELLGETYILFNKHMKANKREQIQLGIPIFGQIKEPMANIQDIPALLQSVIDHLIQWHIVPENRKPNGCIINYFDEGEHSQPYLKPPHLDQPVCTLILSESTMAFGRTLINDGEGNYKGQLMLSMKEGSVLVMRNHSADMARHALCASPTRRVIITFSRVRPSSVQNLHLTTLAPATTQAMALWFPKFPNSPTLPNGVSIDLIPKWGVIQTPVVMLAPVGPVVMNPGTMPHGGTGVFLPWAVGSRKLAKRLPPRAQRVRFLASRSVETHISDTMSDHGVEGRV